MGFALNRPFLYFLYYPEAKQKIYEAFHEESKKLRELDNGDLEEYRTGVRLEDVHDEKQKFRTVGFIMEFLKNIRTKYYCFKGAKNPLEIQALINSFPFNSMSLEEGFAAIVAWRQKLKIAHD